MKIQSQNKPKTNPILSAIALAKADSNESQAMG